MATATIANTISVVIPVSLREGQTTRLASERTSWTNCAGDTRRFFGSAILIPVSVNRPCTNRAPAYAVAGVAGLEPATLGFGDRCSTN